MIIILNGVNSDKTKFTYNDLSFGKELSLPAKQWTIKIEKEKFIELLKDIYDNCIKELKRDDELVNEFHPPYPNAREYPSLDEFLSLKGSYFLEFFSTHFIDDFFKLVLGSGDDWEYVLQTIDNIVVENDLVILSGKAYER